MMTRLTAPLLLVLAAAGFAAQVQSVSAAHPYPRWDEVSYLALARDYAREGGVIATIRCHLDGRCREDIRHPLYQFLLQAVADDQPGSFADAKLVTFGTALFLLWLVYFLVRRRFGPGVAATTAVLLGLTANLVVMSASLVHDVLFTALIFAVVYALMEWQERSWAWWFGAGVLIGLAYLTKGIGHLLFVPLLVTGLYRHRLGLFRRGILYAALAGFAAAAFFLLWRNFKVYGNPLHNFSVRAAWIDRWEDVWTLSRSPEWKEVGMSWYLRNHSLLDLAWRMVSGFGITIALFVYSAGLLTTAIIPCAITGCLVVALGVWGLVLRHRQGHRGETVAIVSTAAIFFLGFSFGAQAGLTAPRYLYPIVVLLLPWAAFALHARVGGRQTMLQAGAAMLLIGRLVWFGAGLAANPRSYYGMPGVWRETSLWFSEHLAPGESFGLPYHSFYSTWDLPHPDLDPRWAYSYRTESALMRRQLQEHHIAKLLVDFEDEDLATYRDRFSAEADEHGPLHFFGWPRCFADGALPSRFLVYCRGG